MDEKTIKEAIQSLQTWEHVQVLYLRFCEGLKVENVAEAIKGSGGESTIYLRQRDLRTLFDLKGINLDENKGVICQVLKDTLGYPPREDKWENLKKEEPSPQQTIAPEPEEVREERTQPLVVPSTSPKQFRQKNSSRTWLIGVLAILLFGLATVAIVSFLIRPKDSDAILQDTQTPTDSSTPSPPEFYDDFIDGLDDGWDIEEGDFEIVNGMLTNNTEQQVFLTVGDENWTNYEVEVEFGDIKSYSQNQINALNYVVVLSSDEGYVAVTFNSGLFGNVGYFYEVRNGDWEQITNSQYHKDFRGDVARIVVENSFISLFSGHTRVSSFQTDFTKGKVGIGVNKNSEIRSITVSPLP